MNKLFNTDMTSTSARMKYIEEMLKCKNEDEKNMVWNEYMLVFDVIFEREAKLAQEGWML